MATHRRWPYSAYVLLLVALAFAVYAPGISGGYFGDDFTRIFNHEFCNPIYSLSHLNPHAPQLLSTA